MKNNLLTKILAVVMSIALVCIPLFSVVGNAQQSYEASCPYVYVHGFMGCDIYEDPTDPDSAKVWPPSTDSILAAVKGVLPELAKLVVTRNWDNFSKAAMPYAYDIFAPSMLSPDGTVTDGSGVRFTYPEKSEIKKDSKVEFVYDWRIDPIEVAGQLNDFINYVTESSGCEQVVIECHSFGGLVTNTYATLYGNEKIRSIMYNTTAIFGETYTGELLTGDMNLDADSLTEYLKMVFDQQEYRELLSGVMDLLNCAGITDAVCSLGNVILKNLADDASKGVLAPLFGGWLSIWAMTMDDKVEEAMDHVFNTLYADSDVDHSGLVEKIENYNKTVRPYHTQTLRQMNEDANVYVFSRYGYPGLFLTDSWKTVTDSTVDSANSSFGATIAPYGEKLSDEYLAKADAKYISPDKTLDASTCLFPDQTWFARRYNHADNCDYVYEYFKALLYYDGQATVSTFDEYPQFMLYDLQSDSLVPDSAQAAKPLTFFERILAMFKGIFTLIKSLFRK